MLIYQLQKRTYRRTNDKEVIFPNEVEIVITFEPSEQFGVGDRPSKTAVLKHKAKISQNLSTGRGRVLSDPPLEPIEAMFEKNNVRFEINGNKFIGKADCESIDRLDVLVMTMYYVIPMLLNLEFPEAPVVKNTCGRIGEATFNWELFDRWQSFDVTTKEKQEKRVIDSLSMLEIIRGTSNRRLLAALNYYYVARRLNEAGNTPYEFLSEVILNLWKVLSVLFGDKRDDVRIELKRLDYSEDEIELKFIPIMILRNAFGVSHASVALPELEQLEYLYSYLDSSEEDFRDLLKKVTNRISDGSYSLKQDPELSLVKDKEKMWNNLLKTFKERKT